MHIRQLLHQPVPPHHLPPHRRRLQGHLQRVMSASGSVCRMQASSQSRRRGFSRKLGVHRICCRHGPLRLGAACIYRRRLCSLHSSLLALPIGLLARSLATPSCLFVASADRGRRLAGMQARSLPEGYRHADAWASLLRIRPGCRYNTVHSLRRPTTDAL